MSPRAPSIAMHRLATADMTAYKAGREWRTGNSLGAVKIVVCRPV